MNINKHGVDLDEELTITVGILHKVIQKEKNEMFESVSGQFINTGFQMCISKIEWIREHGYEGIDEILAVLRNPKLLGPIHKLEDKLNG